MLNIIDISNWQRGLNLSTLIAENPTIDGVVVKATGGVGYVDNTCDPWVQWLIQNGRPWGFYHFLDDDFRNRGGKAEAQFFVENTRNYFGHGIPVADYEHPANNLGAGYLLDFLREVYRLTGIKPMVYVSCGLIKWQKEFADIAAEGYPLWIAQYASNSTVVGFQSNPWQSGSVEPFGRYWMHQYTSHGRLPGWGGNLDFNLFYGSFADWCALAHGEQQSADPLKPADPIVVSAVLMNEYGTKDTNPPRAERLQQAGYDPASVQNKLDELYAVADKVRPLVRDNMDYLNSIMKIVRS